METQHTRLRKAREDAGFRYIKDATAKFKWTYTTYVAHENGQNGYDEETAAIYAQAFNVTKEWLMLGINPGEALSPEFWLLTEKQRQWVLSNLATSIAWAKENIK